MHDEDVDEILGITRCVRCGQRLDGDVECPVCSGLDVTGGKGGSGKWVFFTAAFLTSPLSLWAVLRTKRLSPLEKLLAVSGCLIWPGLWRLLA